ncbi:hypothetical protein CCR97_08075 [Rhodoplanes elegans]|uniref:Uncharacterized protein n=1 Tax=Rhodoplanes elegans TaxID=29408 RepID=A0A327KRY0_9BRAD|nr:hypothetical protein [Rhodoplanes elegans]MBK5958076.1 hypothetical protein [Rhodoplanes elegans]MBK5958168.1 hypothetical protein [Rhodoplanes elegans]RAI40453.1 hypothetical protein CH338_06325 [Rhodoplanes elegans]
MTITDRISFSSAGAVPPRAAARHAAMLAEHPPMFPPPVPVGVDLTAAYDAACERYARDGVETDRIEAQRLGAALDR